ncbi:MAG: 2OG-Fe(II) oxygenase [Bacteroidetes bacterium]|nr:MAG: 2OG-Fe(II) oxygenase [Bacteroidota bacterium]
MVKPEVSHFYEQIVEGIISQGYFKGQFPFRSLTKSLYEEVKHIADARLLRPAKIGKAHLKTLNTEIRSDSIIWIDKNTNLQEFPSAIQYIAILEDLKNYLNSTCFANIYEIETFYAHYPPEAFYKRHLDRFNDSDTRLFTAILYLNPHIISEKHGGQLRMYISPNRVTDIVPSLHTFVMFDSGRFEHEVLPAQTSRYSITSFFRRRNFFSF